MTNPENTTDISRTEQATLGGGCFWCLEAVYDLLRGVESVESGYAGGHSVMANSFASWTGSKNLLHSNVAEATPHGACG